jgi:hypothetical protein
MISSRIGLRRLALAGFLICSVFMFGACAQKAKLIKVGAAQFEVESLAAIQKIDELRLREITAAPLSEEKASEFFVEAVKKSTNPINLETLRLLLNPLKTQAPKSEAQWQAFLQTMREQYTLFASTFTMLDKGSLLAASEVRETIPILDKLIAQLAAIARSIAKHPAEFIRERAAIAAELEAVRETKPYNEVTDLKLRELESRLRKVALTEEQITRETIEQSLKAARLGTELRVLLENYDRLTLDDVAQGLSTAFRLVGDIPGLDLSGLKERTEALVTEIQRDESLKDLFDKALSEISLTRGTSG